MRSMRFLIVLPIFWVSLSASSADTLKQVHVVFRHGGRNPDESSLTPDCPYKNESYYPEGYGQLTNQGKLTEYNIGVRLRKRYDSFLTDTWNINYIEARTTDTNRTKQSLELVLAGLYPPVGTQKWGTLAWQPIPYNYYPVAQEKELLFWGACSNYWTQINEVLETPAIVEYGKRYTELLNVLTEKTGSEATLLSPFNYYFGFLVLEQLGFPLESWVDDIYPEPIHSAAVDYYYLITNTTSLKQIAGGFLIRKILEDAEALINGTLSPANRKLFLYSGHEMNVATLLLTLGAYHVTDIPAYGSHVIVEVHKIDGIWGIKLFFENYESSEPIAIRIPNCGYFCSVSSMSKALRDIIPEDIACAS
ncbi:hypothetical protein ABEB36_011119 [Hypothenemus hampei]|uniref:acid phosphatase n=1 Tax=Hypothenemus hampei TaxID=57062 RepID=A0ABD1EE96_HYPHA